jgi:hypothetical protein
MPFGTHHTKMVIAFFASDVRVTICTANFVRQDWNFMTQVWCRVCAHVLLRRGAC